MPREIVNPPSPLLPSCSNTILSRLDQCNSFLIVLFVSNVAFLQLFSSRWCKTKQNKIKQKHHKSDLFPHTCWKSLAGFPFRPPLVGWILNPPRSCKIWLLPALSQAQLLLPFCTAVTRAVFHILKSAHALSSLLQTLCLDYLLPSPLHLKLTSLSKISAQTLLL